jgi:SAM-dependent methyltransferase
MRLQVAPIRRAVRRYGGIAFDWLRWKVDRIYDLHHGTDTSGIIESHDLSIASENRVQSNGYEPSSPRLFRTIMQHVAIAHEDFVFIDVGSGKGRALLLASDYPFSEIIGIELSHQLHDEAARNLSVYKNRRQRCSSIQLVCTDASDYELPTRNMVLYLYNPFRAEILSKFMDNIKKVTFGNAVDVYIMYYNARHPEVIEQSGAVPYKKRVKIPHLVMRRPRDISEVLIYSNRPIPTGLHE